MSGTLYLVPTPIGNLGDISSRMAETLASVDFIAAEDTRVTLKLLNHLGLKKPLVSYYRHNTGESGAAVLAPSAGGGGLCPGHRRRDPCHQRPRGGLGAPMCPRGHLCGVHPRTLRPDHRSGGLWTPHRAVYL